MPGGRYHPRRAMLLQTAPSRAIPRHRGGMRPRHRGDGRVSVPQGRAVRSRADDAPRDRRRERRGEERRRSLLPQDERIVQESGRVVLRAVVVPTRYGLHRVAGREERIERARGGIEASARSVVGFVRIARGPR